MSQAGKRRGLWKPLDFIVIENITKCAIPSNTSKCFHIIDLCQTCRIHHFRQLLTKKETKSSKSPWHEENVLKMKPMTKYTVGW